MKEENFNEKENCSAAFKYCDGVSLTACGNSAKTEKADNKETKQTTEAVEDMSFDEMVDAAKVQPLHFTDGRR